MSNKERQHHSSGSPYEPRLGSCRAVRVGHIIAVAGTAPIGKDGKTVAPGDVVAQARRCFEIVTDAVRALGAQPKDVIRTRMLLTRIEDWIKVGEVHGEFFREARPATTVMQVIGFTDPLWLIEVEADAVVSEG